MDNNKEKTATVFDFQTEASKRKEVKKCPPHKWDRTGERCEKCGQKDWM